MQTKPFPSAHSQWSAKPSPSSCVWSRTEHVQSGGADAEREGGGWSQHRAGGGGAPLNVHQIEKNGCASLWRNGIARWTSNPEAPGSSPGRDDATGGLAF